MLSQKLTENLVVLHLDVHSLASELIHAFSLSQEELSQSMGVVAGVDVVGNPSVEGVIADGDVDCALLLHFDDEFLQVQDILLESGLPPRCLRCCS